MAHLTLDDCAALRGPGRLLRRLEQQVRALIEARFDEAQLTFSQWIALRLIGGGVVSNPGELSRELNITTGATTRMIDTIEERGWVSRDRASDDRRVVGLSITDAGRAAAAAAGPIVEHSWNQLIADFDQAEIEQFVSTLSRLLGAVERVRAEETGA